MQSRPIGVGIAIAAVIAAAVLFVVLREDEGTDPEPAPQATEQTTTGEQTTTEPADADQPAEPDEPRRPSLPTIVVRNGEPVGGVAELEVRRGDPVRFIVRSDVDEEIHVHGFDVYADVEAGARTRVEFPAEFAGIFEVEMHGSGTEIARITVQP